MPTTIPWGYPASVLDNQQSWLSTYGPVLLVIAALAALAYVDKGKK